MFFSEKFQIQLKSWSHNVNANVVEKSILTPKTGFLRIVRVKKRSYFFEMWIIKTQK